MPPRPYQTAAIQSVRQAYASGYRRVLLQAPTGAGKTHMAAEIVRQAVSRDRVVLYVVPREQIHKQTLAKLRSVEIEPAELRPGRKTPDAGPDGVILAMAQTLARRELPVDPQLIIIDEGHTLHASHTRLLSMYPRAWVLVLTATPARLDGKPLGDLADIIVPSASVAELTALGNLVPASFYAAPSPDLHEIPIRAGDFANDALSLAYRKPKLIGAVADHWLRYARGRRTLTFAASRDQSRELVAAYDAAGIRAEHVDGDTPDDERDRILDLLRAGRIDVVCNVGLFIEGLDVVEVECVTLATATASLSRYMQMVGRGLRPSTRTGKRDLVVIDHGGNVYRHGLPEDEREWSLTGKVGGKREAGALTLRTCKACLAVYPPLPACPRCGATSAGEARRMDTATGTLVRVSAAQVAAARKRESRSVPPRPEPDWIVALPASIRGRVAERWRRDEQQRAAEGYALPDPRAPRWKTTGWAEVRAKRLAERLMREGR